MEGIHGLNPALLPQFPAQSIFRIYISCLTQLNLDRFNRISTTDTRMLRRVVRDSWARSFSAQRTISMWESVRRGEREYIFPYQENADAIFNSALVYDWQLCIPMLNHCFVKSPSVPKNIAKRSDYWRF
jgi:uridine kinase